MSSRVQILADKVVKEYGSRYFDQEIEKARLLSACAQANGFPAPRILAIDVSAQTISYDRIFHLRSLREDYLKCLCEDNVETYLKRVLEAGQLLAILHRDMTLQETVRWSPPPIYAGLSRALESTPHALLHGDFGFSNVFSVPNGEGRTIGTLDASPNGFSSFAPHESGSIYLDIGHFVSCLNGLIPIRHYLKANWGRLESIAGTFLDGYETTSGFCLDRKLVSSVGVACAKAYFSQKFGWGFQARMAFLTLYNDWKGNRR